MKNTETKRIPKARSGSLERVVRREMRVLSVKTPDQWQQLHRRKYKNCRPSILFIAAIQADALRIAGNTVAFPDLTKEQAAIELLSAAAKIELQLPSHLK